MTILLPLILVLALIFTANIAATSDDPRIRKAFTILMVLLNAFIVLFGLVLLILPEDAIPFQQNEPSAVLEIAALAMIIILTGIWGIVTCWPLFRRFLARFLPLNPDSPVHLVALILAGYLVGNTALALNQEVLQQLNPAELAVSLSDIVLQQAAFVLVALAGVGLLTRRDPVGIMRRLGLTMPTFGELVAGVGVIFILLLIQGTVSGIWAVLDPEQASQLGNINEALLAGFDSLGEWFVLAVASGIGEEMLFRGALQPVFGLPLTSILFAVVHIQYGLTPITIAVFFLGLILGIVRHYTNTSVAIFVHFGYNFSLGLLSMLALYLEQFVTP